MHAIQETSICSAVHYRVADLFSGDKELIDAVSRRTPWSRPRTIKLDLRGPHEWTLAGPRLGLWPMLPTASPEGGQSWLAVASGPETWRALP